MARHQQDLFNQGPRDLRTKIREALKEKITIDELADLLLESDWDFTDPARKTNKSPSDIRDFLKQCRVQVALWSTLSAGRQNFLQMVCDCYCRWLEAEKV